MHMMVKIIILDMKYFITLSWMWLRDNGLRLLQMGYTVHNESWLENGGILSRSVILGIDGKKLHYHGNNKYKKAHVNNQQPSLCSSQIEWTNLVSSFTANKRLKHKIPVSLFESFFNLDVTTGCWLYQRCQLIKGNTGSNGCPYQ